MLQKKVLVVVDYQVDFVSGTLAVPGAAELEEGIVRRILRAYDDGDKVIFLKDTHPKTYLDTQEGKYLPIAHCIAGTPGHELYGKVKALENKHDSSTLEKLQFGTTEIPALLKREQIVPLEFELIGVAGDICVITNALILKTQYREVPVSIDASLSSGCTPERYAAALVTARSCQVNVFND